MGNENKSAQIVEERIYMNIKAMKSPNERIEVEYTLNNDMEVKNVISYRILYDNKILIDWSSLGFVMKDVRQNECKYQDINIVQKDYDDVWKPLAGEKKYISNKYLETIITLKGSKRSNMLDITFRVYNSGVAFTYKIYGNDISPTVEIMDECTTFNFNEDYNVYATYRAQGMYEKIKISEMQTGVERPLVVELEEAGLCVALAEAKLVDYARMKFVSSCENGKYIIKSHLTGKPLYFFNEESVLKDMLYEDMVKVKSDTPLTTPWRVVMIADSPAQLYEKNDIILNLNEPCAIKDTSFIKFGKALRDITISTKGSMACIDFAEKRNIQYIEFDAGWYGKEDEFASDATFVTFDPDRCYGELDLEKSITYAKSKGIGVLLYINHRAMINQLDELLPLYKKWGVDGIKFGFVEVGTQRWTTWLHECIRKAAEYNFVLTIHDEYRPTGYQRTYPNLLTQEGIRGDEEIQQPASNTLTTVFTRMLAGPGDNTVCYYDERVDRLWSHAYQLAKSVVIFSPLMFLYWYDKPIDSYDTNSGGIIGDEPELEFFDDLVTTWDDTKVLNGEISKYVTMARKKGDKWFLGTMNADEERDFDISLSFLDEDKEYTANIYTDDETIQTRTHVKIERVTVTDKTILKYTIKANQGLAMRILPIA